MKMMNVALRCIVAGMMAGLLQQSASAAEDVVVTVNKVALPESQLNLLVNAFVLQGHQDTEELRQKLTAELAAREAVAQQAKRLGLDKTPEFAAALAYARRDMLVNAFQADYLAKHPVVEADIQALYEKQVQEAGDKEFRIRHVLVETEDEAKAILAATRKGKKLEALAREKSLDSASRAMGGDIGWQVPILLVQPVRDAVMHLEKGQVSEPVQSPFGWHVIQVDDIRAYQFPALDSVRESLIKQLSSQAVLSAMAAVRDKAEIK